jgi:hypothetical protein
MPVTKDQADMLAALACAARPHGARRWDPIGVTAAIANVQHLDLAEVMATTARAAADRDLHTPGAIGNPAAPCWRHHDTADATVPRDRFDPATTCTSCGLARNACESRRVEGDDHVFVPVGAARGLQRPAEAARLIADDLRARIRPLGDRPDPEETTHG